MKYIITGGAGFIGSILAQKLLQLQAKVCIIDDLSTGHIRNIRHLLSYPGCKFIRGDASLPATWDGLACSGDVIIHLAATVGVKKVCEDPFRTLENNIRGIETVLEIALCSGCKVVYASSSEVYGQSESEALKEEDALIVYAHQGGRSAYVLSKLMGEHYCFNYFEKYALPVIVCRFFNIAGINQSCSYGMVVPTFVQQALNGQPITIFGDGEQRRSFCNVHDLTDALYALMNQENTWGQAFNIGNTETISINKLAEFVRHQTNNISSIVYEPLPYERCGGKDIHHRTPCIDKIKAATGWYPRIPWKQTVLDVLRHEKNNMQQPVNASQQHAQLVYG
ncbi:MAG TPA: NAD-dependent epimerase/dehydratase family protein [Chitinophagaceae bacterium]|nr:NAD-dependent epimerase/dehydratase family protein [Chitinophagaceae bacterium]